MNYVWQETTKIACELKRKKRMNDIDQRNLEESEKFLQTLKDNPKFLDTAGRLVGRNDESRIVWFSARCTYWTDDWSVLSKTFPHGIPICPNCKSPGLQAEFKDWVRSAKRYDEHVSPMYAQFVMYVKEKCITFPNGKPVPIKEVYKQWYAQQQKGMKSLDNALSDGINKIEG